MCVRAVKVRLKAGKSSRLPENLGMAKRGGCPFSRERGSRDWWLP